MGVPVGAVARCVAKMTDINGSIIENVYYYKNQGVAEVTTAIYLTAIEAEMTLLYTDIQSLMPSTLEPLEIEVDIVEFVSGKLVTSTPVGTIDWTTWSGGTDAGEGLPQGNAAVVNFPTGVSGVVGRKYLGPLGENTQANGLMTSGALTAIAGYASELLDGFTAAGLQQDNVIMSTKIATAAQILGSVIRTVVGYQRRRKAGRGI